MNKNDQEYLVQKIRTQYTENAHPELDALRSLDRKVKAPANAFAYCFGIAAALILGGGMSFIMTDISAVLGIAAPMLPGLILGLLGLGMAIATYPIYKRILSKRRDRYAANILALSNRILQKEATNA